ncbi:acyltransferase [Planococcus plakortidis]
MSGRNIFEKYKKIILLLIFISKFIPKIIFDLVWNLTSIFENKFVILIRYLYLKKYAGECGDNIYIGKYVILKNIQDLQLGSNISIHAFCYLDSFGCIKIGDNVSIANHTSIISFNHTFEDKSLPIKYNLVEKGKINIEQDVWIGSGVRILPDVTIKSRSIVAAGAVVVKDVLVGMIVGGVPAKTIKEI